MKALIYTAAAAIVLSLPAIAFAQQNNGPVTRAQVRAELAALESVGYNPNDWINYPENIQAAEQRLAAKRAAEGR
jgi:outer membrane lipoprotein-sorting protein